MSSIVFVLALAFRLAICADLSVPTTPNTLYTLPTDVGPAFCSLILNTQTGSYDLAYSSFTGRINVADSIHRIADVSVNYLDSTLMQSQLITQSLVWPNEVDGVPDGVFGSSRMWSVANAFFLPGKNRGSISVIDMTNPEFPGVPIMISSDDGQDWYYHRVLWEDMDGDGDLDAVTERAYGTGANAEESQSVWFENPGLSYPVPNWTTHIIYRNMEDIAFRLQKLPLPDGTDTLVLISSGFYSRSLTLTWTSNGDWSDESSILHRVIDTFGWYFDVEVVDLNQDGKLDLLTTTWSQPGFQGSVLAYEMPSGDWRTDDWTRHILSLDFKESNINGNGSPGGSQAFWRSADMETNSEKPHIMVSGDDDGQAYVLIPNSEVNTDWTYTQTTIYSSFGTVGAIAVGDVDADGYTEVFIPSYTLDRLVVMSYKPQA